MRLSAASTAAENKLIPTSGHYRQAELQIAIDHCLHSWAELLTCYEKDQEVLEKIENYREELALAKRYRSFLFTYN